MPAYYNEINKYCAKWLRNLIAAGHIAPGDVDERSIEDVRPDDLRGYTQCHFFAGIGVWSYALRLAGWSDDRPVWTGSCPCQPFSAAGKGVGFADERHLWPAFFHLIKERRPAKLFGEQVASKDADPWIDLVQDDLEALGYAVGAIPFPSAGVGAPHIRDRLYWVADADRQGLAQRERDGRIQREAVGSSARQTTYGGCAAGRMADADGRNASTEGIQRFVQHGRQPEDGGIVLCESAGVGGGHLYPNAAGPTNGHWRDADWLFCRDGKWRPVEPGTSPLATGAPARVGRLRAYGNAINAHQAAEFIKANMSIQITKGVAA